MIHSFFFHGVEEAPEGAEDSVRAIVGAENITDLFQQYDEDSGCTELRFHTDKKLDRYETSMLIRDLDPSSYALNCEGY